MSSAQPGSEGATRYPADFYLFAFKVRAPWGFQSVPAAGTSRPTQAMPRSLGPGLVACLRAAWPAHSPSTRSPDLHAAPGFRQRAA